MNKEDSTMNEHVIIVTSGDYDAEFATKLHNLLPEHNVESVIWTEKQFINNKPQLSNKEHLIFLGRKEEAKKQAKAITVWGFDMYGCKLGVLNNICVMTARFKDLPLKDQQEFAFYCEQRTEKHPDIIVPSIINNPIDIGKTIKGKVVDKNDNSIRRAQYSLLIYEFIDNWLDKYIGGKEEGEE